MDGPLYVDGIGPTVATLQAHADLQDAVAAVIRADAERLELDLREALQLQAPDRLGHLAVVVDHHGLRSVTSSWPEPVSTPDVVRMLQEARRFLLGH